MKQPKHNTVNVRTCYRVQGNGTETFDDFAKARAKTQEIANVRNRAIVIIAIEENTGNGHTWERRGCTVYPQPKGI